MTRQQLVYDREVTAGRPNRARWEGEYIRWWGVTDWESIT
jgi:hypothetical protein